MYHHGGAEGTEVGARRFYLRALRASVVHALPSRFELGLILIAIWN